MATMSSSWLTCAATRRPSKGENVKEGKRYDTSKLPEAQFEPGSTEQVLKNLLGITSPQRMNELEAEALERAVDRFVRTYDAGHCFTAADICSMHKLWLGDIYEWAGSYRQVNMSKGAFTFATSAHIPTLMSELEKGVLRRCTPCSFKEMDDVVAALAEVHTELILIHPFREGNGRVARILSTLMALQAGLPLLNFSPIAGEGKEAYFAAVRAGLDRNYKPMEGVFREVIEKTISSSR